MENVLDYYKKLAEDEILLIKAFTDAAQSDGKCEIFVDIDDDDDEKEKETKNKIVKPRTAPSSVSTTTSETNNAFEDYINNFYVYEYELTPWKNLLEGLDDLEINDDSSSGFLMTFCLRSFEFHKRFLEYLHFFSADESYERYASDFELVNEKFFNGINEFLDSDLKAEKFVDMLRKNYKQISEYDNLKTLYDYFFRHYKFFRRLRNGLKVGIDKQYFSETPVKDWYYQDHPYRSYLILSEKSYEKNVRIFPFIKLGNTPTVCLKAYYGEDLYNAIDYDVSNGKVKRFYLPSEIALDAKEDPFVMNIYSKNEAFKSLTTIHEGTYKNLFDPSSLNNLFKTKSVVNFSNNSQAYNSGFLGILTAPVTSNTTQIPINYYPLGDGHLGDEAKTIRGTCLFRI